MVEFYLRADVVGFQIAEGLLLDGDFLFEVTVDQATQQSRTGAVFGGSIRTGMRAMVGSLLVAFGGFCFHFVVFR